MCCVGFIFRTFLALFFVGALLNVYYLEINVIMHCGPGSLEPENVIGTSWNIRRCQSYYPKNSGINIWYYNAKNMDPVFLDPPSMIRTMIWLEITSLSLYYVMSLIVLCGIVHYLPVFNGIIKKLCLMGSGAQIFYTTLYLLWHYYTVQCNTFWVGVFLPTIPWVIFPSIFALLYL